MLHLTQGDRPSAQGPAQSALVSSTFTLTHSVPDTQTSLFLKHARHSPASSLCKDHSFYKYLLQVHAQILYLGGLLAALIPLKEPITFYVLLLYFSSPYLLPHVVISGLTH